MLGERAANRGEIASVDDGHHLPETELAECPGVEADREERRRPLGPVDGVSVVGPGPGSADHRVGDEERPIPSPAGQERRPADPLGRWRQLHGAARVEHEAATPLRACGGSDMDQVGFRRGSHDRAAGGEDVRDDDGGRLARSRWTEDKDAMLGPGPCMAAVAGAEIYGMTSVFGL